MEQLNYLDIILKGFADNPEHLDEYFYEISKDVEKNHVSNLRFFKSLNRSYDFIIELRDKKYYDQLREHYFLISARKTKGEPVEDLEAEKPQKENISVNLKELTNHRHSGDLSFNNLVYIENSIVSAIEKIIIEKKPKRVGHRIRILEYFCRHHADNKKYPWKSGNHWLIEDGGTGDVANVFSKLFQGKTKLIEPIKDTELKKITVLLEDCPKAIKIAESLTRIDSKYIHKPLR